MMHGEVRLAFCLLCALCDLCGKTVFAAEGYEIRAERVETVQAGEAVRRTYAGRVEARVDSLSVRSGQAVYTSGTEEVAFTGGVEATDPARRVLADTLIYLLKEGRAVVSGGALVTEGGRELRADRVILLRETGRVEAAGRVGVRYGERRTVLTADALEIAGGDSGVARGRSRLSRAEADTLVVTAEEIRFARGGARVEGEGDVEMSVGGFQGRCRLAVCDSDSVGMAGSPVLRRFQGGPEGADSSEVGGERVRLRVAGGRVRRVEAVGDARILHRRFDAAGAPAGWSRLGGDTLTVEVERDTLRRAVSEGGARSLYRDVDSSQVELSAAKISVLFEGGRVRRVEGEGRGKASYGSADGSERSLLTGDAVEVEMAEGRIGGVLLRGHAVCEYTPDDRAAGKRGGKSRLSGDLIRLAMHEGELKRVAVEGGAVGSYRVTEEEREGK